MATVLEAFVSSLKRKNNLFLSASTHTRKRENVLTLSHHRCLKTPSEFTNLKTRLLWCYYSILIRNVVFPVLTNPRVAKIQTEQSRIKPTGKRERWLIISTLWTYLSRHRNVLALTNLWTFLFRRRKSQPSDFIGDSTLLRILSWVVFEVWVDFG